MSEQLRIILIIIVSVSIFGLIVFVIVKNFIKSKIDYYLIEKIINGNIDLTIYLLTPELGKNNSTNQKGRTPKFNHK